MSIPPTGTVTFLFTDIQGSTAHWEQYPHAMRSSLTRHDQLLRQSIEDNGGFVFKTIGDAFCAAFTTANKALEATLTAQVALSSEPWELPAVLLVRMALHTGACEERESDYYGPPVNRVTRLLAAGHGGQVLLSDATQELVRDTLPDDVTLQDLGRHRLKDLGRPEQVFQLLHPILPADFPPLRSLDNPQLPNNLPQQATSFIGREKEGAAVQVLMQNSRLVTVTGSGGSGKTRLSLQVAADLLDRFPDGSWLIELAPLSDPTLVPQAVAQVLGVKEKAGQSISHTLVDALKAKHLMLVLDNCEHLVAACAALASDLLKDCPHVRLLASSREPLGVSGEQTYRVPSLSRPEPQKAQTVESLSQYEAVALFIERARAVHPSFTVTDANAPAVAQVCFHLDGIPLAIELAAARVRAMPVEQVMARLDDRFRLLTGGSRTALPRQQTLRALMDWSYDLLTDQERTLLVRLSVFVGGWTLAAAETVCSGESVDTLDVLDLLTNLVDKSLVVYEERADGQGRYGFLETVRQYGRDRLVERGGAEVVGHRHAAWSLALAEAAKCDWFKPVPLGWWEGLETEHDNLRAGLSWYEHLYDRGDDERAEAATTCLRLAMALGRFWTMRGYGSEGHQWLVRALKMTKGQEGTTRPEGTAELRITALVSAGLDALSHDDYLEARAWFEEVLETARRLGDEQQIADAMSYLGNVAEQQGDFAGARVWFEEELKARRRLGDERGISSAMLTLGWFALQQGDCEEARTRYGELLEISRRLKDDLGIGNSLTGLGQVALHQGDFVGAQSLFEEDLAIERKLGYEARIGWACLRIGDVVSLQGEHTAVQVWLDECLAIEQRRGDLFGIACAMMTSGKLALRQGDYAEARASLEESLAGMRRSEIRPFTAEVLAYLGYAAMGQDDRKAACQFFDESLAIRQELGDKVNITLSLTDQGNLRLSEGDITAAQALYRQSLAMWRELPNKRGSALTLMGLTRLASTQGQMKQATRLSGAINALYCGFPAHLPLNHREEYENQLKEARTALGEEVFSASWAEGETMDSEQAVEYALNIESNANRK